ncbi:cobyrinate a,c-diamide synthase [Chroococcus sp. FPU101]|uniref:cobyrinate a,c-diamide synthase n=1 Tax=Chroococcus sp. FPU101 TaxID=1974212 RepID=UPI001A8E393F|nr:cobyrinate a,c-diamide synthase [Chroococcus sp. FPU101]
MIIAGERSGVGKTTITLAILAFLTQKGYSVQSFKVGPDYIDPMFHTAITSLPCRNLDPILTSENYVLSCFGQYSQNIDYALIEGVMGLFDGVRYDQFIDYASTAHIARILNIPVILVIDCSRLSGSVAAIAQGYSSLDPKIKIAGVILNKVGSDRHLELLQEALSPLNIPILGVLRRHDLIALRDRHLGLIPTLELSNSNQLFEQLAILAQTSFDWEQFLPLLSATANQRGKTISITSASIPVKIAVAQDKAFSFYYQDNLDILEKLGAELIFWSPMSESSLPKGIDGLYFGGGFPEVFAQELAENRILRQDIKNAIAQGLATYAECGGMMYLCEQLIDFDGKIWDMVGSLPTVTRMEKKLTLGYRQATAQREGLMFNYGDRVKGHEFHYSQVTHVPEFPLFELQGLSSKAITTVEGWTTQNLHASYLHIHFGGYPAVAQKFLDYCLAFSKHLR